MVGRTSLLLERPLVADVSRPYDSHYHSCHIAASEKGEKRMQQDSQAWVAEPQSCMLMFSDAFHIPTQKCRH